MARKGPQITAENVGELLTARQMVDTEYGLIRGYMAKRFSRRGLRGAALDERIADALGDCWQRVRSHALRKGAPSLAQVLTYAAYATYDHRKATDSDL